MSIQNTVVQPVQPLTQVVKLGEQINTTFSNVSNIVARKVKPVSLNNEPWTGFGAVENRVFIDDFCHEKELTVKVQAATYNGSTIKIKQAVNYYKGSVKAKQEIKVWFPLQNRIESVLHLRLSFESIRVHYDHGISSWGNKNINLYGSFGFLRDWSKYNAKLGVTYIGNDVNVDNRLKVTNDKNVALFHRTTGRFNNGFRFGLIGVLDLANKQLIKKDLLLGFEKNSIDVSLKATQPFNRPTHNWKNWRQWFDSMTTTAVFKRNSKQRYGLELGFNPFSNEIKTTGLVEYKYTGKGMTRVKLDNTLNLTILVKNTISDKLSVSVGASIPVKKQKAASQSNSTTKNKVGIQLDFNI